MRPTSVHRQRNKLNKLGGHGYLQTHSHMVNIGELVLSTLVLLYIFDGRATSLSDRMPIMSGLHSSSIWGLQEVDYCTAFHDVGKVLRLTIHRNLRLFCCWKFRLLLSKQRTKSPTFECNFAMGLVLFLHRRDTSRSIYFSRNTNNTAR